MKLKINKEELLSSLRIAEIAVGKTHIYVSEYFYLEALDKYDEEYPNTLKIRSSSINISVVTYCEAEVIEAGEVLVPSNVFTNFISNAEEQILIEEKGTQLELKSGKKKQLIPTQATAEFFSEPTNIFKNSITFSSADFKELLNRTLFAASTDGEDIYRCGYFYYVGEKNTMVVTCLDTVFMSSRNLTVTASENIEKFHLPIYAKLLEKVRMILPKEDTEVLFGSAKNDYILMRFYLNSYPVNIELATSTAVMPPYLKLVKFAKRTVVKVNKKDILKLLAPFKLYQNDSSSNYVQIFVEDGELKLKANSDEYGLLEDYLEVEVTGEQENKIAVSIERLITLINKIDSETILLGFTDYSLPLYLKPEEADNFHLEMLVPMSLKSEW